MAEAVISAGGRGTRLGELAREMPKCLVRVGGQSILQRQLEELARNGVGKVWLLTGHLGEQVEEFVGSRTWPLGIEMLHEGSPLGTGGGLAALRGRMGEPFIFLYGDLVLSVDFSRMLAFHRERGAAVTMLAHPNSHPFDSDLLLVRGDDSVERVLPKREPRSGYYRNLVNAGAYILSPRAIEGIEAGTKLDFEKDILPPLLGARSVYAYRTTEFIKDMGTPERLAEVEAAIDSGLVEARRLSNPQKALFLDRDGTINRFVDLLCEPERLELLPGAADAIKLVNQSGYLCFVVSNQPVVARNLCSMDEVEEANARMETLLGAEGAFVDDLRFCPHHPDSGYPRENAALKIDCECRKPKPGMLLELARRYNVDLSRSFMIGDTSSDAMTAANAGARSVLVASGATEAKPKYDVEPDFRAADLLEAVTALLGPVD